jgi:hypothetical protein
MHQSLINFQFLLIFRGLRLIFLFNNHLSLYGICSFLKLAMDLSNPRLLFLHPLM